MKEKRKKYKYTWYTKINRYCYYMLLKKYKNTENHGGKSFVICEKITKYKYTWYTKIGQCCYYMLLKIQKLKYTKILKIIVV